MGARLWGDDDIDVYLIRQDPRTRSPRAALSIIRHVDDGDDRQLLVALDDDAFGWLWRELMDTRDEFAKEWR